MKRILVVIIALLNTHSVFSQNQDTLYLNSFFIETNKDSAVYHRVLNKLNDDKMYVLTDFYANGKIFGSTDYISKKKTPVTLMNYAGLEKKNKFVKHGKSVIYYKNGDKKEEITYIDGEQQGTVVHYEENPIYIIVENMPRFPGGEEALSKYITETIKYPSEAYEAGIHGRVYVKFIIDTAGKVKDPEIIRSVHHLLDEEALRVVGSMPDWQPGTQRGKPVNVYYTVPVNFVIQEKR